MRLTYYKGPRPNFGDDLNEWLLPKLFPNFFDDNESELFIGIGSILFDGYDPAAKKIVFGSGYGGYSAPPVIDKSWDIRFVRGKMTAKVLGVSPAKALGDSAILIRSLPPKFRPRLNREKSISFMPHWESAQAGIWQEVCKECNFNYIDPRNSVDVVLSALQDSDLVLTEAMHGAIVSDALRIPWVALEPIHPRHRPKWQDWASALELELNFNQIKASSLLERVIAKLGQKSYIGSRLMYHGHVINLIGRSNFIEEASQSLRLASRAKPCLSGDAVIRLAHERMLDEVSAVLSTS